MLNLLVKYAEDHGLKPEPGFAPRMAKWAIACDAQGRFLDILALGNTEDKKNQGQEFKKAPELTFSQLKSGSEPRSHFLIETASVVALHCKGDEEEKELEKMRGKHDFFIRMLINADHVMPGLIMLAAMLENEEITSRIRREMTVRKVKPTDKVTFAINGHFPVESLAWHDWWRAFRRTLGGTSEDKTEGGAGTGHMRCFATGALVTPVQTALKISGLADVGGQPVGDALVCFDKDAFTSYGLEQAANAAVSEQATAAYRDALNDILKRHSKRLAGAKIAYWFAKEVPPEDDPFAVLETAGDAAEGHALAWADSMLNKIHDGSRPDMTTNRFYALTLSGAAGRVMVRDWMEGSFDELVTNVAAWFDDLVIARREGGAPALPPKFLAVLGACVRDLDDLHPSFVARLWRVAVRRESIPREAMVQALARVRVDIMGDQPANHARMGLLKAYHLRNLKGDNPMGVYLNPDHPHPAYHCGRLMAWMAALQRNALGDVGAGVVQRFYASASATPALVLGRLVRTSQFHLNKLEPGLAFWYETEIAEVWGRIKDRLPATLTLEEQSLFALGYYQQLATRRANTGVAAKENNSNG